MGYHDGHIFTSGDDSTMRVLNLCRRLIPDIFTRWTEAEESAKVG